MNLNKSKKSWMVVALIVSLVWLVGCAASNQSNAPADNTPNKQQTDDESNNAGNDNDTENVETNEQWENYIDKGREEGTVTVVGSHSPEFRQKATEIMKERFGIDLEYLTLANAEAVTRIEREAAANQTTIDVVVSGTTEIVKIPDLLERLDDKIVMPEVADTSKWQDGELKWIDTPDKETKTSLQLTRYVYLPLWVNTTMADPETLLWEDLLDPDYTGKIVVFDPRGSGQGQLAAMYLISIFGEEYVKQLYNDQKVVVSTDGNQMAGWLASGRYPIALGLLARNVESFLEEDLPIASVSPEDGPGFTNGKIIKIIKNSPNPNAAVVFTNWLASKEGMELFSKSFNDVSLRNDIDTEGIPEFLFQEEGVEYPDFATEKFYTEFRPQAQELLIQVLGR